MLIDPISEDKVTTLLFRPILPPESRTILSLLPPRVFSVIVPAAVPPAVIVPKAVRLPLFVSENTLPAEADCTVTACELFRYTAPELATVSKAVDVFIDAVPDPPMAPVPSVNVTLVPLTKPPTAQVMAPEPVVVRLVVPVGEPSDDLIASDPAVIERLPAVTVPAAVTAAVSVTCMILATLTEVVVEPRDIAVADVTYKLLQLAFSVVTEVLIAVVGDVPKDPLALISVRDEPVMASAALDCVNRPVPSVVSVIAAPVPPTLAFRVIEPSLPVAAERARVVPDNCCATVITPLIEVSVNCNDLTVDLLIDTELESLRNTLPEVEDNVSVGVEDVEDVSI